MTTFYWLIWTQTSLPLGTQWITIWPGPFRCLFISIFYANLNDEMFYLLLDGDRYSSGWSQGHDKKFFWHMERGNQCKQYDWYLSSFKSHYWYLLYSKFSFHLQVFQKRRAKRERKSRNDSKNLLNEFDFLHSAISNRYEKSLSETFF